ncbi:MAG: hypothetical protein AAF581_21210 [Planctomycetota bacterium]
MKLDDCGVRPLDSEGRKLMDRLDELSLGPAEAGLSFEKRLARENDGWSEQFATRVCREYRRFVLLCHLSGRPLTPSDAVDQAWHLHLCYSRSYWHRMCRDVLGVPLHHEPTRGGSSEASKFVDWYEATREAYEITFGEKAPTDIWPHAEARFANAAAFRRVDTSACWMISRATVRRGTAIGIVFCAILGVLAGCASDVAAGALLVLGVPLILAIMIAIGRSVHDGRGGKDGGGCGGGGLGCGSDSGCGGGCGGCGS